MPFTARIALLGSGEPGREFVISAKRLGAHVITCDSYAGAPEMQMADGFEVFPMLDGDALRAVIAKHRPDLVVPEIEAIRTEVLAKVQAAGTVVVPSARSAQITMNRDAIRDLAAETLGLTTSRYRYAKTLAEAKAAFDHAVANMRGDRVRVIVEAFVAFDYKITLQTVRTRDGLRFCPPIGHRQAAFAPQTRWKYSNLAYAVAGLLVEKPSGQRFADYAQANILDPLGMANSGFDKPVPGLATPYGRRMPDGSREQFGATHPVCRRARDGGCNRLHLGSWRHGEVRLCPVPPGPARRKPDCRQQLEARDATGEVGRGELADRQRARLRHPAHQ